MRGYVRCYWALFACGLFGCEVDHAITEGAKDFRDMTECRWTTSEVRETLPSSGCSIVYTLDHAKARLVGDESCGAWSDCLVVPPGESFEVGADNWSPADGQLFHYYHPCDQPMTCP
jgi:hypothetical protein